MSNPQSIARIAGRPLHPTIMPFAIVFLAASLILAALMIGIFVIIGWLGRLICSIVSRIQRRIAVPYSSPAPAVAQLSASHYVAAARVGELDFSTAPEMLDCGADMVRTDDGRDGLA
jgi:hypothetical protein